MMIRNIRNAIQFARELSGNDLRIVAQGYADDVLGRYGYVRRPNGFLRALPMIGAFGAGVAVGAGIGILVAPQSGARTRASIEKRLESWADRIREATGRKEERREIITESPEITHGGSMRHS